MKKGDNNEKKKDIWHGPDKEAVGISPEMIWQDKDTIEIQSETPGQDKDAVEIWMEMLVQERKAVELQLEMLRQEGKPVQIPPETAEQEEETTAIWPEMPRREKETDEIWPEMPRQEEETVEIPPEMPEQEEERVEILPEMPEREEETVEVAPVLPEQEEKTVEVQFEMPEQEEPTGIAPEAPEPEDETVRIQIETAGQEEESTKIQPEITTPEALRHNNGWGGKAAKYAGGGLYVLLIIGICIVPLLLLGVNPLEAAAENRTKASLPEIQTSEGFNWNFLQEAGAYFTDHFAFRQELVSLNAGIRSEIFGVSSVDDVIVGENGWLYYAATLDDYQHKNSISERALFNIAHNMALMQEYTEGVGSTFVFTIAPNKNSLYDDNMPERLRFQVAEKSDAERLKPWLIREGVNYVDLFELFGGQKETLYYARDSHWNDKGAVLVYNALLDACGKKHESYEKTEPIQKTDYYGDLGMMLYPVGGKPENRFQYPADDIWHYAEGENVEDQFIRTENEEGDGALVMYRDSFGNSLLPYMAQTFSQAIFSKQVPYSLNDLVAVGPDILIVEKVERHLPTLGKVPPLMDAPIREMEKVCVSVESAATTVYVSKEGGFWKLEGTTDPVYMNTDSHIYVEVDDGSGAKLYEAFCVSASDMQNGGTNDYGYMLYVSKPLLAGDTFHVRVMIEQEDAMVVLLTEDLPVSQEQTSTEGVQQEEAEEAEAVEADKKKNAQEADIEDGENDKENAAKEAETEDVKGDKEKNTKKDEDVKGNKEKTAKEVTSEVTAGDKKEEEQTEEKEAGVSTEKPQENEQTKEVKTKETKTAEEKTTEEKTAEEKTNEVKTETTEQVEMEAATETQTKEATQNQAQSSVDEVSRVYMEDCGMDSGYWVITYSDGHVEYLED